VAISPDGVRTGSSACSASRVVVQMPPCPRSAHVPRNAERLAGSYYPALVNSASDVLPYPCARLGLRPRGRIRLRRSTIRRTVPLRTCRPAVPPTLYQALPSRHREKYRREPLGCVRVPAGWPLSSGARTTWRPCSTSGCRRTPDRHRGPEGPAEARCRTRSTRLPPTAGASCAAWPSLVSPVADREWS